MNEEQKIRQIVQQELRRADASGRFGVQSIPHHTHNGVDSLPVASPTFTYAGFIPYDPLDPTLGLVLPSGWTIEKYATGEFSITHNLGTELYSVVAVCAQSTNDIAIPVVNAFKNSVEIFWFDVGAVDTSFFFTLTQINNRSMTQPNYVVRNRA